MEKKNISKTCLSRVSYVYNNYGQLVKASYREIVNSGTKPPITETNTYDVGSSSKIFGALLTSTDSLGNTTRYFYDEDKGLLLAEIYADGTGVSYDYDDRDRLVFATPSTYSATSNNYTEITDQESVSYTYNSQNQLSAVATYNTRYFFNYTTFGNMEKISIENMTLATYEYGTFNGKLKSLTYGNGTKVEYKYDNLDRVTEVWYTEVGEASECLYEYHYTNDGYLKQFDNHIDNTSTVYTYDGAGRLINILECNIASSGSDSLTEYSVQYSYDAFDRVDSVKTDICDSMSAAKYSMTVSSEYDIRGRITSVSYSSSNMGEFGSVTNEYDNINRVTNRSVSLGGVSQTVTYTYDGLNAGSSSNATTSYRVKTYQSTVGNTTKTYRYDYDDAGYITEIYSGNSLFCDYEYDDQGQLTIFYDGNFIYGYSYDKAGNIISRYKEDDLDGSFTEYTYTYGNSKWGDLLTSFNGNTITYDGIGNPLQYYDGTVFTWEQGRRLSSATQGNITYTYTYNDEGVRISKDENGIMHRYIVNGTQIVAETLGDIIVVYLYDEYGSPIGMQVRYEDMANGQYFTYFFEKNMFGDIIAIYDTNGVKQVSYSYDAFGNSTQTVHVSGTRATYNNLRYRGYYYDFETGFYYLNSRYYDPVTGRFINADGYISTGQGLVGYNMFAYCGNNPVMRVDPDGEFWDIVFDVVSLAFSVGDVISDPGDASSWIGLGLDIVDIIVPVLSGTGEVYKAYKTADNIVDTIDAAHDTYKAVDKVDDVIDTTKTAKKTVKVHGNSLKSTKTNYGYALVDRDDNIMKFGETVNPKARYSQKYLNQNGYSMKILESGSKADIHYWQYDMNMYYRSRYGSFPPLNKRGW